jgi:hypothetical protein
MEGGKRDLGLAMRPELRSETYRSRRNGTNFRAHGVTAEWSERNGGFVGKGLDSTIDVGPLAKTMPTEGTEEREQKGVYEVDFETVDYSTE